MVLYCAVVGCKKASDLTKVYKTNHRFHRFPLLKEALTKKWLRAIDRTDWKPTKNSRICSDHFLPTDYKNYSRLKSDAVPSQKLPCSCSDSSQQPIFSFTPVDIGSVLIKSEGSKIEDKITSDEHFELPACTFKPQDINSVFIKSEDSEIEDKSTSDEQFEPPTCIFKPEDINSVFIKSEDSKIEDKSTSDEHFELPTCTFKPQDINSVFIKNVDSEIENVSSSDDDFESPTFNFTHVDLSISEDLTTEKMSTSDVHFKGSLSFRSCATQTPDCCANTKALKRKIKTLQRNQQRTKKKIIELQAIVNKLRSRETN